MYSSKPNRSKTPLRETAEESIHAGMYEAIQPIVAQEHEESACNVGLMIGIAGIFMAIAILINCSGCSKRNDLDVIKPLAQKLNGAI